MKRMSCIRRFTLYFLLCIIAKGRVSKGTNFYISRASGDDSWSCNQTKPCKTIWRVVTLASRGDIIHLDGTNTEQDPYTCQSTQSPGLHINTSLTLTGFGPMPPQIRCSKGTGLTFDGSGNTQQMNVTLSGLLVNDSFVYFQDSSANISGCTFVDSKQGVQFVISRRMLCDVLITNSTFVRNSECISVVVNSTGVPSSIIQVKFTLKSSSFSLNAISNSGNLISFTESPDKNQTVNCFITMENVSLYRNIFNSKGLVFLEFRNGNQDFQLHEVTLTENRPSPNKTGVLIAHQGHSEIVISSRTVNIFINASNFTGQNARSFSITVSNVFLQIYKSRFHDYRVEGNGGAVSVNGSDGCKLNISNSSFINTAADQGGAINVECAKVRCTLQDNIFEGNTAAGVGGGMYFSVLYSSSNKKSDTTKLNNTSQSKQFRPVNNSDIDLVLFFENLSFKGCSAESGGSLTVGYGGKDFTTAVVRISNSKFISNLASSNGGALLVSSSTWPQRGQMRCQINIEGSTFTNNTAFEGGAISLLVNNQSILILEQVTMESNRAAFEGGVASIRILFILQIWKSYLRNNTAENIGGAFYIKDVKILKVVDSLFVSNNVPGPVRGIQYGGAFLIETSLIFKCIEIINTTFENCSANIGGVLFLEHRGNLSLLIQKSRFVRNRSLKSPGIGGALYISLALDGNRDPGCKKEIFSLSPNDDAKQYPSWDYKSYVTITDTTFDRNVARVGGAVYLTNGKTIFRNCYFVDNFAMSQGGHIYVSEGSASVEIQDTLFHQTVNTLPILSEINCSDSSFIIVGSSGALNISNTSIEARPYRSNKLLMTVTNGRLIDLGNNNLTKFFCPVGSKIDIIHFIEAVTTQLNNTLCKIEVTTLQFSCTACGGNYYSLERGRALGSQLVPGFQCLPCPFGANCTQNVVARRNFWGFEEQNNPLALRFTICPVGYCSQPKTTDFPEWNSCQGNRSGKLCGKCKHDYTEALYSPQCRPSHQCNDYWFWPVALAYVSLMALYLTFKPPVVPWIKRQILWFTNNEPVNEDINFDRGYLKILFYFYQAANLFLISGSSQAVIQTKVLEPIVGIFNFKLGSLGGFVCPFPGFTVVTKQLFSASYVFGTLLVICLIYGVVCGVQRFRGKGNPSVGPYVGGILQTMLLGYTTLASTSFSLLRCVPIGGEMRLFYDGNIDCYQWWQYILFGFSCCYVIPFVFVLLWGSYKLYGETLSVRKFLLACLLPLPSLIYWSFVFLLAKITGTVAEHPALSPDLKRNLEMVLYDPFKRPEDGSKFSLSWEGVMIGRRLILAAVKSFVSDPLPRVLIMSFLSVLFLVHHTSTLPFRDVTANITEAISLVLIVVLGLVTVFFASFLSLAVPFDDPYFSQWRNVFEVVEIVILCFVPAVLVLLVVGAAVSQLCRVIGVVFRVVYNVCNCFRVCLNNQTDERRSLVTVAS